MSIQEEPNPRSGGMVILTGDQIREIYGIASSLESAASLLLGCAITLRQLVGVEPMDPSERIRNHIVPN